jgi:hypothetical protein
VSAWSRASADDGVERVGEQAAGTTIETMDVFPVPRLAEVALDEADVTLVVELMPDVDRLARETTVQCYSKRQTN